MTKYTYVNHELKEAGYNHACSIRQGGFVFDTAIRLIVLDREKIIYIRINEFDKLYQGLEYKKVEYQFEQNLRACEGYLKRNYKKYKVYNSYNINELADRLQRDILNS